MTRHAYLKKIETILAHTSEPAAAIQATMDYLAEQDEDYYWVGVYLLRDQMLHLGPYNGPATDHVKIPLGRGVCGTAVQQGKNQVIGDVSTLDNYLACNIGTKSEIVVLIHAPDSEDIIGQIDVDGRKLNQFDSDDEEFLTQVAALIAPYVLSLNQTAV